MNLPFTGIATFAKVPYAPDLATLDADVAIIGAPYDLGTQVRSGTRLGPRGIRNASTIYGMRTPRYYDAEFDEIYLDGVRIVDCGDVDMVHGDPRRCLDNIQEAIGAILARGVLPVTLGGDHAVPIPILRAYGDAGIDGICVVQIDAHLDFVDERLGVREGHGNVMRRIAEMPHTHGLAQIGIRGPGSSDPSDFEDARRAGQRDHRPAQVPRAGRGRRARADPARRPLLRDDRLRRLRSGADARATARPRPGGLTYHEGVDLLRGIAELGDVVGLRLRRGGADVRPDRDHAADGVADRARLPRRHLQGARAPRRYWLSRCSSPARTSGQSATRIA